MGEERLTGLALLNVHRDIAIDLDDAVDKFNSCSSLLETYSVDACG